MLPDAEETVLDCIARILFVPEYPERQGERIPLVHLYELPEGTAVAPLASGYQLFHGLHSIFLLMIVRLIQS
jgi:hypothetical protein